MRRGDPLEHTRRGEHLTEQITPPTIARFTNVETSWGDRMIATVFWPSHPSWFLR
jgi:hypothetical protein